MKCPSCKHDLKEPIKACPKCKQPYSADLYSKLSLYFGMRQEYDNLLQIRSNLSHEIDRQRKHFLFYEETLKGEMKALKFKHKPVNNATSTKETADQAIAEQTPHPNADIQQVSPEQGTHPKKDEPHSLEVRIGQRLLLITGVIITLLGVGYFLKFSFDKGWIGPAGRVALAYLWGISFLLLGQTFRKQYETFGLYIFGGGIGVLFFSTFSAFQMYHLFGHTLAFFLMILTTALSCIMAVVYDSKWLAVLGIIGGFATPIVLSTGSSQQVPLMLYMTILNGGIFAISFYKKWDLLNYLGFFFTYILFSAWFMEHYKDTRFWPTISFLTLFYLIYSIVPFSYQFFKSNSDKLKGFAIITPNSIMAFGYSFFMVERYMSVEWVSVICLFYAGTFLLMANFLYKKGKRKSDAFAILIGKSAMFLIITVPVMFSEHWITIFWLIQGVAFVWIGLKIEKKYLIIGAYLLLFLVILKFLVYDYLAVFGLSLNRYVFPANYSYTKLVIERIMTTVCVLAGIFTVRSFFKRTKGYNKLAATSSIVFGILLFIVLNVEVSSFAYKTIYDGRFAAISILWGIFSLSLMLRGIMINNSGIRKTSFMLFSMTIIKVFFVDMERFSTPYRILSFLVLGIILVSASYFYYRYKGKIMGLLVSKEDV